MRIALEALFKDIGLFFIDTNYRKFIWLACKLGFKKRYQKTSVSIANFKFVIPDAKSFIWQFYEIFGNQSYHFKTNNPQPIIYDCGANVGTSVLYLKQLYPTAIIHAFEPDPIVFDFLKQNIEQNNCTDIHLHQAAVWTEDTTLHFASEGADSGKIEQTGRNTIPVKAIELRKLLARESQVDFLKMDIEGAEYEVLIHCDSVLSKVNHIFVECHSFLEQPQRIAQLLELLQAHQFRYYIQNESIRKSPFVNRHKTKEMDMQLNVFAYR